METRCTHCGATTLVELEGEDTPAQSMKCVACGETFVPVRGGLLENRWVLNRTNGEQLQFDSLYTLQAMVRKGQVSPDDEISRTGQAWRKLRDIVELAPLFQEGETKPNFIPRTPSPPFQEPPLEASLEFSGKQKLGGSKTGSNILVFASALLLGAAAVFMIHHYQQEHNLQMQKAKIFVDDARRQLMQDTEHHIQSSIEAFRRAVEVAPDYAPAHAWLALSLMARSDALSFDAWLGEQEVQWDPGNVGIDEERQSKLRAEAASRLEESFLTATRAAGLAADSVEANFVLADYYQRQDKVHDFRRHLTRIKIVDPNHLSRHYFEALSTARPLEARLISWEELLINGPSQNRMRLKMVHFLLDNKDYARALQEVDVVLNKAPAHRFAARLRGHIVKILAQEQEQEEAKAATEDAEEPNVDAAAASEDSKTTKEVKTPAEKTNRRPRTRLSPLQTLLRKAEKSLDAGQPNEAMNFYREALVIKSDNIDALAGLGFCYLEQGSLPAAYSAFELVLRQAKDFSEAHRGLGKLWRVRGNKEKALEHFRHYLKVLPMGSHAASVRTAIMELEAQP